MKTTQYPSIESSNFGEGDPGRHVDQIGGLPADTCRPIRANRSKASFRATAGDKPAVAGRLALSLEYMKAHLHEPMRISTLCAMTGYSQSRFFDLFKTLTGDSPMSWFIRARMRYAAERLESSDFPIKQIAMDLGYEDQFYFSRLFKSVYGLAPSMYRAQTKPMCDRNFEC